MPADGRIEIAVDAQQGRQPDQPAAHSLGHDLAAAMRRQPAAQRVVARQAERRGHRLAGLEIDPGQVGDPRLQIGDMAGAGAEDDAVARKRGAQHPQILLIEGEVHGVVADEIEKRDFAIDRH